MALHNYIYIKHHTDIATERKIAREHDPRPPLIKGIENIPKNEEDALAQNVLVHTHSHTDIKEDWEYESKFEKWDDESSSDTDFMKTRLSEKRSHKLPHFHAHTHAHAQHRDSHEHTHTHRFEHEHFENSTAKSSDESSRDKSLNNISLCREEIDLILSAKPMKLSKSQQSQNQQQPSQQQPSIEKKSFKESKFVIIDGKKKKLKSRFTRTKRSSSNQET